MSSRLSSTNSLSDGGLLPRPKPRRVLSAEGRRRRNARNRSRQKRKRKSARGKDDVSDSHTPSTLSLSIAPSEIQQAKELNPVVNEKQQSRPEDLLREIDDILKVLDNGKTINSSPTAVVKTVLDHCNNAETVRQSSNVELSQLALREREKRHQSVPDLDLAENFRLTPADTAEPQLKSRVQTDENDSGVLQSGEEPSQGKLHGSQEYARAILEGVLRGLSEAGDGDQIRSKGCDQEPNASGAGLPFGLHRVAPGRNHKANTTTSKRRRVDVEYAFVESMTVPAPIMPLPQSLHPQNQLSKEQQGQPIRGNDGEAHIHMGTTTKAKFLDDILDLEKGVDFMLPEMGESHIAAGGQAEVPVDIYPVQADNRQEKNSRNILSQDPEKESGNNGSEGKKGVGSGASHVRPGEDLEREVGGTEAVNVFGKSRNDKEKGKHGTASSTQKRIRATSSVSAALRFARKQKMLQEDPEVKHKPLADDTLIQEPMKRKKKKKKRTRHSEERQMLEEKQYNESAFVGFGNDVGVYDMRGEADDCGISAVCSSPPPAIEADEDTPSHVNADIRSGLGVPKAGQAEGKLGEKGGGFQTVTIEERMASLERNSVGEYILADVEPVMPATENERDGINNGDSPQPASSKDPLLSSTGSGGKRAVLDFEGKRKFFDDVVTLMIDTTVELEFLCKELFRVRSKVRDKSPS